MNTKLEPWALRLVPPARLVSMIAAWLVLALANLGHAATNTVTSLADSGAGSLRQVIASSASEDSILFGVTGTITLTSGELLIDKGLTITGPGTSSLAINGAKASRIFNIQSNVTALISSLTVTNGQAPNTGISPGEPGGGIYNSGTLWVSNCVIAGNFSKAPY